LFQGGGQNLQRLGQWKQQQGKGEMGARLWSSSCNLNSVNKSNEAIYRGKEKEKEK
jgi:hypothetical protein